MDTTSDNEAADTQLYKRQATIERVASIKPVIGADRIECATVLGWETVVPKGEMKAGDLVVWHNPDTICDSTNPVYQMLAGRKFRLGIAKIRGQISQGLALPVAAFEKQLAGLDITSGLDVTKEIGIKHDIKPTIGFSNGASLREWPSFIRKTDQPNLRSNPDALAELKSAVHGCIGTLKLDGTSATYYANRGVFGMCSRNRELVFLDATDECIYKLLCDKLGIKEKLLDFCQREKRSLAIQGEICGPGLNGNHLGLGEPDFWLFHVWDCEKRACLDWSECVRIASVLGLKTVPVVLPSLPQEMSMADLIAFANALNYPNKAPAEGIVVFPIAETESAALETRLSVKVISERFGLRSK